MVAFDDAVSVVLFGAVFAGVSPFLTGVSAPAGVLIGLGEALLDLVLSMVLGDVAGLFLHLLTVKRQNGNEVLLITLALLFLVSSLSFALGLSLLFADMAMGAVLVKLSGKNRKVFDTLEPLTPPVFALFFIIAGTELDVRVFTKIRAVYLGLLYLTSRFLGKFAGIQVGGLITRVPKRIRHYLGFCLFPQAGVAIGLALYIKSFGAAGNQELGKPLSLIVNIVLFSVCINELIGPVISKFGIKRGVAG